MAKTDTFECSLITPERAILKCDAVFAAFPAHDGEMGILPHRAPLVCKMGIGSLRIETPKEKHVFFIDGGFAQMVENRLTLLTEQAKRADQIDAGAAGSAMATARTMKATDERSQAARVKAIRRAQVQLKMAKGFVAKAVLPRLDLPTPVGPR